MQPAVHTHDSLPHLLNTSAQSFMVYKMDEGAANTADRASP